MNVTVNGEQTELASNATLETLLEQLNILKEQQGIAVAVNDEVVPRKAWGETELRAGDTIEIIHAVQGG